MLPQILVALFVIILAWLLAKLAGRLVQLLTRRSNLRPSLVELLQNIAALLVWLGGILIAATIAFPEMSPTDLLATATGACMTTVMGIRAEAEGWPLAGTRVRVEKHMTQAPRRVGRLVVELDMPAALGDEARASLERVALACPVAQSLHPDVELDVRFRYTR